MNVKVEIELYDQWERDSFELLLKQIESWRGLTAVARHEQMQQETALAEKLAPAFDAPITVVSSEQVMVSDFGSLPRQITDADLEAAITAYWKKMGLPAAKAVLAKYEVERVGAIPANRRGEAMLDMGA